MKDVLNKAFLAGLGAISITRDKLEGIINELIKQGEISREEKLKVLDNLYQEVEKRRTELGDFVKKEITRVLKSLEIPTREEFNALQEEIERLRGGKAKSKQTKCD